MDIEFLHLTGFKYYPRGVDLDLSADDRIILKSAGDELIFYFQVILGIIFGLSEIEKQELRDKKNTPVFTGLIRIILDDCVLNIERNFTTDIVSCMLVIEDSSKVVFHDKDFVDNGTRRSYLRFLKRYLTFTDKTLLSELCMAMVKTKDPDLESLLNFFNNLSALKTQIATYKNFLNEYEHLNDTKINQKSRDADNQIVYFENQKKKIHSTIKAEKLIKQISETIETWSKIQSLVREKRNEHQILSEIFDQKYPFLNKCDSEQLFKDVILRKKLTNQKIEYDNTFKTIQSRIDDIEINLNKDLFAYGSLPQTYESYIQQYKERSLQRKKNQAALDETRTKADIMEKEFQLRKQLLRIFSIIMPVVCGGVAFFIFDLSPLFTGGIVLVILSILTGYTFYEATKFKSDLWVLSHKQSKLKNEISNLTQWIEYMRSKALLLKESEKEDVHIPRHSTNLELKGQLDKLMAKRDRISEIWKKQDGFKEINDFNQKYGKLIDLNRDDLGEYLDTFTELKLLMQKYSIYNKYLERRFSRHKKICKIYWDKLMEKYKLLQKQSDISTTDMSTKELIDDIDIKIKTLKKTS